MYGNPYYKPYWQTEDPEDSLEHYGVKGMKWGVIRESKNYASSPTRNRRYNKTVSKNNAERKIVESRKVTESTNTKINDALKSVNKGYGSFPEMSFYNGNRGNRYSAQVTAEGYSFRIINYNRKTGYDDMRIINFTDSELESHLKALQNGQKSALNEKIGALTADELRELQSFRKDNLKEAYQVVGEQMISATMKAVKNTKTPIKNKKGTFSKIANAGKRAISNLFKKKPTIKSKSTKKSKKQ